ncbi:unnamed protein product [Peniophora sp. CBMAI 1063]|nr:unnamed protein product [Peniophora sp. CBMAI 1063]
MWEMSSYAGPVTRDDIFFYNYHTGFYVMQDRERYIRAEPSKLYELLTWVDKGPALTKKGAPRKRQPPPHWDESVAYYTAQALHYGLKPKKTKEETKKTLLDAFKGGKSLQVPEKILALEKELRKLWQDEDKKARARYEQEEREREEAEEKKRVEDRRRHEEILAEFEKSAAPTPKAATSRKRKATDDGNATQKKTKTSGSGSGKLSDLEVRGEFAVKAPYLAEQWDDASGDLTLMLSPSRGTGKHLWGSFDFGIVKGIIRAGAPPTTVGATVAFKWRGHEQGEGQMEFGEENKGTLTFLGNGKIRGTMVGGFMSEFVFSAIQDRESLRSVVWNMHVKEWKEEWRGINDRTYNAARVGRWGNWCAGGDYKERPAGSDTSDAGSASDAGEDDDYNYAL